MRFLGDMLFPVLRLCEEDCRAIRKVLDDLDAHV
jgi:hypothetical protein